MQLSPVRSRPAQLHRASWIGCLLLAMAALSTPALAQSEGDIDDVFKETATPEPSVRNEKDALLSEASAPSIVLPDEQERRRIIQTFQRKTFLKYKRYEGALFLGFVTNDPFVNRYLGGGGITYHATEVLGVELSGAVSPVFGDDADRKAITKQIIDQNGVTPDISKIQFYASGAFSFSPIYGKVAVGNNKIIVFDLFGVFGTGVVNTVDDLEALQKTGEEFAVATESQLHPTLNYGGGMRVVFGKSFAARLEGRGLSFIEVLDSTTLEMKNNFTLLGGVSFFLPGID